MKKHIIAIFCTAFIVANAVCSQPSELSQPATDTRFIERTSLTLSESEDRAAQITPATPVTINTPTVEPGEASDPDIPTIVDELYLGILAGNGHR